MNFNSAYDQLRQDAKPKIPMTPKYYYVVNTDCHPIRCSEFYTFKYFGQICSWHRTLAAAIKAEKRLHRHNVPTTAIYGADFIIRDSDFLAECYGGAAPQWRVPVKIEGKPDYYFPKGRIVINPGKCGHVIWFKNGLGRGRLIVAGQGVVDSPEYAQEIYTSFNERNQFGE